MMLIDLGEIVNINTNVSAKTTEKFFNLMLQLRIDKRIRKNLSERSKLNTIMKVINSI